jgi:hypothetical protein
LGSLVDGQAGAEDDKVKEDINIAWEKVRNVDADINMCEFSVA